MMQTNDIAPFRATIGDRVKQRDVELQLLHNRWRRTMTGMMEGVGRRFALPSLLPDYLKMFAGSALGFWIIAWFIALAGVPSTWTYLAFGLMYAGQATWYGHKLAEDPTFTIPKCGCAAGAKDDAETVLNSKSSRLLGVPNAVWALLLYAGIAAFLIGNQPLEARIAAAVAVIASAALAVVMTVRLRALCTTCVNMAAINVLLLWQLMR